MDGDGSALVVVRIFSNILTVFSSGHVVALKLSLDVTKESKKGDVCYFRVED